MKANIEDRVVKEAFKLLDTKGTVRSVAKELGISKSTVHFDLSMRLKKINFALYKDVQKLLKVNLLERHTRGGEATKRHYEFLRKKGMVKPK